MSYISLKVGVMISIEQKLVCKQPYYLSKKKMDIRNSRLILKETYKNSLEKPRP